jgi:hypothetical protein
MPRRLFESTLAVCIGLLLAAGAVGQDAIPPDVSTQRMRQRSGSRPPGTPAFVSDVAQCRASTPPSGTLAVCQIRANNRAKCSKSGHSAFSL